MPEWARWLLSALAAIRITWALMFDDGPGAILLKIRERMGAYDYSEVIGPDGRPQAKTARGRFWNCPLCISLLAVVLPALCALFPSLPGDGALAWLGLAGAVMLAVRWRPWR